MIVICLIKTFDRRERPDQRLVMSTRPGSKVLDPMSTGLLGGSLSLCLTTMSSSMRECGVVRRGALTRSFNAGYFCPITFQGGEIIAFLITSVW